jgi:hypothetical protein
VRSPTRHDTDFGLTRGEARLLRSLSTPRKILDYLDALDYDHAGIGCRSPRRVLTERRVQCMDGALFGAAALRFQGRPPLLLDLEADNDTDHVMALFRENGCWGAVGRSNYSGLRYREPIYRKLRELVLSLFEEYSNLRREKTLRRYSRPVSLTRFDKRGWMTAEDNLWDIPLFLVDVRHYRLLKPREARGLSTTDRRQFESTLLGREENGRFFTLAIERKKPRKKLLLLRRRKLTRPAALPE